VKPTEERQFRDFVAVALPGLRRSAYLLCGGSWPVRTHVQVGVVFDVGPSAPTYTDDVIVAAAVDPRFTAMTPGTGG
jgi:hypothetical protein